MVLLKLFWFPVDTTSMVLLANKTFVTLLLNQEFKYGDYCVRKQKSYKNKTLLSVFSVVFPF